jgi:hypothetical protein
MTSTGRGSSPETSNRAVIAAAPMNTTRLLAVRRGHPWEGEQDRLGEHRVRRRSYAMRSTPAMIWGLPMIILTGGLRKSGS